MRASKENARKAKEILDNLNKDHPSIFSKWDKSFLEEFIQAVISKLPTEATFDRNNATKKSKRTKSPEASKE